MSNTNQRSRRVLKLLLVGLGTLVLSVVTQRAAFTKADRQMKQESKSFVVAGKTSLKIETFDGVVTVHAWDKAEVMFTAVKQAQDAEEMRGVSVRAEQRGEEISVIADFDAAFKREIKINGGRFMSSSASVDLNLYVPRDASLVVRTKDGSITVESFGGEADLQTGDGSIEVGGGNGSLQAKTEDGEIRISHFDGSAVIHSGDGQLKLDGRFSGLDASTAKGSIWLSLPAESNATVETTARTVNSQNGFAVAEESTGPQARTRRWRIGSGGGNVLTLRTEAGDISLRRADRNAQTRTGKQDTSIK